MLTPQRRIDLTALAMCALGGCITLTYAPADSGSDAGAGDVREEDADTRDVAEVGVAGDAARDVACAAAPPRLLAPLSGGATTARRPTLRWRLASGTDGARVQLCRDRACTAVEGTLDVAGESARASAKELAPGVHFWRLFARAGGCVGGAPSATWEFFVGPRAGGDVDRSGGTSTDFNGDGVGDVVAGAPGVNRLYGYYGRTGRIDPMVVGRALIGLEGGRFGGAVASGGDLDGDGYVDLLVGASQAAESGRVYVYRGGAAGLSADASATLRGAEPGDQFGWAVVGLGDLNGDGYGDFAVGANRARARTGRVTVYYGSADLTLRATSTLEGPEGAGGEFGTALAGVGDVNGDGFADLAVGASEDLSSAGRTYVFHGGAMGLATVNARPNATLAGHRSPSDRFGASLASAGDVNGDGYADLVAGAPGVSGRRGWAAVYLGSPSGLSDGRGVSLNGQAMDDEFGSAVAGAGDLNQDGYADVVVGAPGAAARVGQGYVFFGSAEGTTTTAGITLERPDSPGGRFGQAVAGVGDVDDDGFPDLLVSAPLSATMEGRAFLYNGASAPAARPSQTFFGADALGAFGSSIAGRQ